MSKRGVLWLEHTSAPSWQFESPLTLENSRSIADEGSWYGIWTVVHRSSGGDFRNHWFPNMLLSLLSAQHVNFPAVRLIPGTRQIGQKGAQFSDFSGQGLIDRLAEIQSPDHDKRHEFLLFEKINLFLQKVSGRPNARIEIPHHREHVLVHMDNKVLPLSSLGMGIHEVIMIAAFCTISEDEIICIEEPEIHLHPLLQRKLVKYLQDYTSNQYFIATHSSSFIDTSGAAIFHVNNDGEQTHVKESIMRSSRLEICVDLGCKASDIVQSNAIIWVEGPSDRIYVRHWISALAPELVEGIHYSIMFYGGRLLSHLSADSDEIGEFIALRSLNQHVALVMDSDKTSSRAVINNTKIRIKEEFSKGSGVCWITSGREIENYVEHTILQAAVADVYGSVYDKPLSGDKFDHALHFDRVKPKKNAKSSASTIETKVDKVAIARKIAERAADLSVLDLRQRTAELVELIRAANQ